MPKQEISRGPTWLVEHPTFRYVEDVKELARKAGLRIVDAAVADEHDRELAEKNPPKLTLKPEYQPAKAAKAAAQGEKKE